MVPTSTASQVFPPASVPHSSLRAQPPPTGQTVQMHQPTPDPPGTLLEPEEQQTTHHLVKGFPSN